MKRWAAEIAVDALKDENVEVMFGMIGGHIQSLVDFAYRGGIKVHQVRHEQAAVYAADAYARISRKPGVCFGTAGPGMLNMVSAIHMAYLARSPLVCFFGGHRTRENHLNSLQEASAEEVCRSITKWTIRCNNPDQIGFYIRKAFRDAMAYPPGPIGIELPLDTFNWEPVDPAEQISYRPGEWMSGKPARPAADPELIGDVVARISRAKRPVLIAGDGVHWADAGADLQKFVDTFEIPFNLRRLARGSLREDHPLAVSTKVRKSVIEEADLVILLGLQVGYFESFARWKTAAEFIQINESVGDIVPFLPTAQEVIGNCQVVLRQMLAAPRLAAAEDRRDWLTRATPADEVGDKFVDVRPIHPYTLAREVLRNLESDATIVLDSFTASAVLTEQVRAVRPGQLLDSGLSGGIGHGIGMGIGAALARPDKPVLVMMGDGGIGVGGFDIETAMRYDLPVVYMIFNDSTLCAGLERYCYGEGFRALGPNAGTGFDFIKDIRYDKMFEPLGCHVELVTEPDQIGPALARSFASKRTSVINVIGTKDVVHPLYGTTNAKEMFWHLPGDEIEQPARDRHINKHYPAFHGGRKLVADE